MSKPSRRPTREARKQDWQQRKEVRKELRRQQAEAGLDAPPKNTILNGKSALENPQQEQEDRQKTVEEQLKVWRSTLPRLLKRLGRIKDPRNPKTIKHKHTVILLYGLLIFAYHLSSRREANRKLSLPMFRQNLQLLFPELETLPHADTLGRLLCRIDVDQIEESLIDLVRGLIRNKKFQNFLVEKNYCIAVDGTRKLRREYCWAEECLERTEDEDTHYYVYVLEADIVFPNGIVIPLLSEFLDYQEGVNGKQDCELVAFRRLAARLKRHFPRLPIMLLLDGLFANGPVFALCRRNHWDFMIVLQDKSLPAVWTEAKGLHSLQPDDRLVQNWGGRRQHFWWVNDITHSYDRNERKRQTVHVVVCEETWEDIDKTTATIIQKRSKHAWVSSRPIHKGNVHRLCNLQARHRWGIESNILVEKHHGYYYEHCFSYNWNAMKGFHYLMRIAHLLNTLTSKTVYLAKRVKSLGVRGLIQFIRETLSAPWLERQRILHLLTLNHQLRLE
jgi:hypothetical protein